MRLARIGMTIAVGAILIGGCSSTRSEAGAGSGDSSEKRTGTITQAIQGGTVDDTHTFAVGVCNGNQCFGRCSGALILPNLVATARHCVDNINYTNPEKHIKCAENPTFGARKGGGFFVTTNTTMSSFQSGTPGFYSVASVAIPTGNQVCGGDIALLTLSGNVPANIAKPIVPNVQYFMWDPTHYVPVFAAVGYGNTTANGNDSGTRRIRQLISVFCVPGDTEHPKCPVGPPPESIDPLALISPKEFIGGSGTCSGDSGSSAFEQQSFDKNAAVSFGVLSRGGEDGTKCEGSVYSRFDSHRDFILQTAQAASANWTKYPEPSWTGAFVQPAPKVDGGVPKKDGGTSSSSGSGGLELGEACETEADCASGVCSDIGDGSKICSQSCDEADTTTCPDGYQCKESLCLPAAPPPVSPTAATTTTTEGCSVTSSSTGNAAASWLLVVASVLLASRRKRRFH